MHRIVAILRRSQEIDKILDGALDTGVVLWVRFNMPLGIAKGIEFFICKSRS